MDQQQFKVIVDKSLVDQIDQLNNELFIAKNNWKACETQNKVLKDNLNEYSEVVKASMIEKLKLYDYIERTLELAFVDKCEFVRSIAKKIAAEQDET